MKTEDALRDLVVAIEKHTARASGPNDLGFVKIAWIEPALTQAREELARKHPLKGTAFDGVDPDWDVAAMIVGKERAEESRRQWEASKT